MSKKTFSFSFLQVLGLGLFAVPAFAASGHHGNADISTLVWPAANFFIFLAILVYIYRKNISPLISARAKELQQHIKSASQKLDVAKSQLADIAERLESVEVEKDVLRRSFESDGQKMAQDIIRSAEQSAQNIRQDMVRRIESEFRQATKEVRSELISISTKRAREKLQSEVTAEQDARLRLDTLNSLRGF